MPDPLEVRIANSYLLHFSTVPSYILYFSAPNVTATVKIQYSSMTLNS